MRGELTLAVTMDLSPRRRFAAEIISLVYIAIIAFVANATGAFYVLFPELGALSHDVFTRPRGDLGQLAHDARDHTRDYRCDRNRDHPCDSVWAYIGAAQCDWRDYGRPRTGLAGRARDLRRPAAAGAGRDELVVSARNHVRNGAPRDAFDRVETSHRRARDRLAESVEEVAEDITHDVAAPVHARWEKLAALLAFVAVAVIL